MRRPGCKDCKNRTVGCHSKCASYLSWEKEHREEMDQIRKIKEEQYALNGIAVRSSIANRKVAHKK